jgi:EAL domain-containing protein (putative c-di-GMP-specific phosphodiesterase class I)/GGDEF domain-containing protein/AmiR/NasT family two-component response regulator
MTATEIGGTARPAPVPSRAEPTVALALRPDVPAQRLVTLIAQSGARPIAVAADAGSLAEIVSSSAPDVLVIDLGLVLTDIASFAAMAGSGVYPPVVALCGEESPEVLGSALAHGVVGFARLDTGALELGAVIAAALAGRWAASPDLVDRVLAGAAGRLREQGTVTLATRERQSALRAVLADPDGLFPVFQPIADLRTGRRFAWIALTRFAGAPPEATGRRFAEARELGLIVELEVAAVRAAVRQIDRLPVGALLCVKASCRTVAEQGLDPLLDGPIAPRVMVELSGAADLEDHDAFAHAVDRLRHRGVRFAVDETGAGFGPLDQVLDLSPAFVRLAGGLTRDIDVDRTRRALALTVISFASHLGAKVIADQIETAEELDALRRLGVDYGLGYHIGRPEPLPDPARAAGGGSAAAHGEEGAPGPAGGTPVLWARARPDRALGLPGAAAVSLDAACTAVLRMIGQRVPGASAHVGLLDRHAGLLRVVDGRGGALDGESGASSPLAESLDALAATGGVPQLGGGQAGIAITHPCVAPHWAVVPFAGSAEQPLATLSVVAAEPLSEDVLDLLRDAGGALAAALATEHGEDPETHAAALRELSGRDRFTGLLNAHRFREVVEEANARAATLSGLTHILAVAVTNHDALAGRLGQAVAGMVLKDVARALALEAEQVDAIGHVGPATFGCVLVGRLASEVEYFRGSVADRVAAAGRRRGATIELRTGVASLGRGPLGDDAWRTALERTFS